MRNSFSVQMSNLINLNCIMYDRKKNEIFLEGDLGKIETVEYIEERVLTIKGTNGTFRIDINKTDLIIALKD